MLFLVLHGVDKFSGRTGIGRIEEAFEGGGVPAASFTAPFSAIREIVLGSALIAGFLTRISAIVLSVFLVGAIIFMKADNGILGSAELDIADIAGLAGVALLGPGKLSVDEALEADSSANLVSV